MSSDTESQYLLDGIYFFNPSNLTITNNETNNLVKIHSTSAKCLLLLIEKHTTIVTQKQLIQYAWEEKSHTVTHNSLYQCILNLRKCFIQLGCDKSIITTVPRKGLMIAEEISIARLDTFDGTTLTTKNLSIEKKKSSVMLMLACVGLATMIICLIFIAKNNKTDFRVLYTQMNIDNKACKYFINNDNGFERKESKLLSQYNSLCKDNKFLYVTAYSEMRSKSILICDAILGENKNTKCTSLYLP